MAWTVETLNETVDAEVEALIVRVFIKKTQKTPRHEIDLALAGAQTIP